MTYKMRIKVGYADKVLSFKDFQQVQDFLRYIVDGSDEAAAVEIWRAEEGEQNE